MMHTYENALRIRKAYVHLIGNYLETGSAITDICIIPADLGQLSVFLYYYKTLPAEKALEFSGFDRNCVRIVVIHEQTLTNPGCMIDLDEYLTPYGNSQIL